MKGGVKIAWREFKNVSAEFCSSSPIHGLFYTVWKDISRLERWLWVLIVLATLSFTSYLCADMVIEYVQNPTRTSLESTFYSIRNVPLPGVGICSNNRMSKKRVDEFVNIMAGRYNRSKVWFYSQILWIGKLYDFTLHSDDQRVELQNMLDDLFKDETTRWKNMLNLLDYLGVQCEDLLAKCFWLGDQVECDTLFTRRLTSDGFCCTFNYYRTFPSETKLNATRGLGLEDGNFDTNDFNINKGLKVLVNNMPEDYFYSNLMFEGVDVKLFNKNDFPDSTTGGVLDVFAGMGIEAFMSMKANAIYGTENIRPFSPERRGCVFIDDDDSSERTSLTHCILMCKLKTLKVLCNCVPFTIPYISPNVSICNIMDLPCLNKHKERVMTGGPNLTPEQLTEFDLGREAEDSLKCPCYPSCNRTEYHVETNFGPLILAHNKSRARTHTFLHIFFGSNTINLYKTDLIMMWFDLICNIGGLCGILMGVSIISLIEFVYYFLVYVSKLIKLFMKMYW